MSKMILALDIGSDTTTSVIAHNDINGKIAILDSRTISSKGIGKGNVLDANLAKKTIDEALELVINNSAIKISSMYVSVSGTMTKNIRSSGSITIPHGYVTLKDIEQALKISLLNAQISTEYNVMHAMPLYFKIDNNESTSNPLNTSGSRLEVYANIIIVNKNSIQKFQNIIDKTNIKYTKVHYVLSSFASSIATTPNENISNGTLVIDAGSTTTDFAIFKDNIIVYSDTLPIGSENLTKDLSSTLNITKEAANMIKNKHASLLPINEENIKKIKVPVSGSGSELKEISIDLIQPYVHARVEEIFVLISDYINSNQLIQTINNNVILTGGLSKTKGIEDLVSLIFPTLSVKVTLPKIIKNGYIDFNSHELSTVAGLVFYALNKKTHYELDSTQELRQDDVDTKNNQLGTFNLSNNLNDGDKKELNNLNIGNISNDSEASLSDNLWTRVSDWLSFGRK